MRDLFILLFLIPTFVFGQGWEKTYGNAMNSGYSVKQTTDGGYIVTGYTWANNNNNVYLIKTDSYGDTIWTRTYGGDGDDMGLCVQQTTDGGYIVTGKFRSFFNYSDVYLIKTDNNGDTLWTKTYVGNSNTMGYSVQQTSDNGFIIAGTYYQSYENNDIYLIKTDESGDTLWTKTYGGQYNDYGKSVKQTTDGGYIITGFTKSYGDGVFRAYLIKTNENGDSLWTKTYLRNLSTRGYSVQQTTDGGYVIAGFSHKFNPYTFYYGDDVYLVKTDSDGDTLWTKTYVGNSNTKSYSVQQTTDGGYIITGESLTPFGEIENLILIKADSNGDTLWTKSYGGNYGDVGYCVQQTTDGGYIITGKSDLDGSGYNTMVYLVKTDVNGSILSTTEIPIPKHNRKLIKIVDLSGREITNPQKNIPYIEVYDDGSAQKKMNIK